MEHNEIDIKNGIKLHKIQTDKFKTNLIAVMLTTKLERESVTKNALIPAILRRGTAKLNTQEEINKKLEEMYGASFDCGLDKTGDNQVLKFYIETVNDEFLPQDAENMLKTSLENIFDIVLNPYLESNCFKKEYVEQEKENLKQIIEGKIDNKARYSLDRCIEEMYKNKPYGLYKYGYIEDLNNINEKNLYEHYIKLVNQCKIDIFVSGILGDKIEDIIKENENIQKLKERNPEYIMPEINAKIAEQENVIQESMDVNQGKLIIGLDLDLENEDLKYDAMIYNSILGGSANSKLFQNVREKESLAYTASSSYYRFKNNIFINCGIEIENFDKALEIIKQQVEDMKNGDFTDEEVENAKQGIIAAIKSIDDEQDTEITYFFSQELSTNKLGIEEYMDRISQINKQNVIDIANKVSINTIYFLKN
ncbi:MAG: insulinase family protein [Clostridia bacterium]|jgi:predicted Zn-dependent peptidase|nr:insulinase family protein [Clostridia bacterium]